MKPRDTKHRAWQHIEGAGYPGLGGASMSVSEAMPISRLSRRGGAASLGTTKVGQFMSVTPGDLTVAMGKAEA